MTKKVASAASKAQSIEALRLLAEKRLPRFVFEFLERGAEDEVTLHRNRSVFAEYAFIPRTLQDVSSRERATTLFGQPLAAPVVIGPTGRNGMLSHQADLALARVAARAGIPFALSTPAMFPLEELAHQVGGNLWFQLYFSDGRAHALALVKRAEAAGYRTLVITVDTPVSGNRGWRYNRVGSGTLVQRRLSARQWIDVLLHPRWFANVVWQHGLPRYAHLRSSTNNLDVPAGLPLGNLQWDDIRYLRSIWPHSLIIKGILAIPDARLAVECGADGIVLSNHGGRQLDGAVSPLDVLPAIAAVAGAKIKILIDGGFRRGSDIAKALALGADAVLLGRSILYGVAADGEVGAARALEILLSELDRVQALLGCSDIDALDHSYLQRTHLSMLSKQDSSNQSITTNS